MFQKEVFQFGLSIQMGPNISIPNKLVVLVVDLLQSCDDYPHI